LGIHEAFSLPSWAIHGGRLFSAFCPRYPDESGAMNEATLDVQPFLPVDEMDFPDGVTYFRLILGIVTLPDYA